MRISGSLLFGIYLAAEVLLLVWVASAFGVPVLVGVLLAGFLLGLLAMRIAGISAMRALADPQRRAAAFGVTAADGSEQVVMGAAPSPAELEETVRRTAHDVGRSSLLFVAGILLIVPGIISDVAGLLMLLPFVRDRIARRLGRSMGAGGTAQTRITVVTADEDGFSATTWSDGPAQSSPPVIAGEILPPPSGSNQDH